MPQQDAPPTDFGKSLIILEPGENLQFLLMVITPQNPNDFGARREFAVFVNPIDHPSEANYLRVLRSIFIGNKTTSTMDG